MIRRYSSLVFSIGFVVASVVGCQVAFEDLQGEGSFPCSEDSDCIEGFVCDPEQGDEGRCVEACANNNDCGENEVCQDELCIMGCIDEDGDGYGSPESEALNFCPACSSDNCQTDCNDNDESINPGAVEACNGKDDDCDGTIDEPITGCNGPGDCPLSAPSDRPNTRIGCKSVERQDETRDECVLVGRFSRSNCSRESNKATCQEGAWGKLSDGCTQR